MQRIFYALCVVLVFAMTTPAYALQREGIVAVVNDEVISYSDVRNRMALKLSTMPGNMPDVIKKKIERETVSSLIDEMLQMQEAEKLGIEVTAQQIQQGMTNIAQQNGMQEPDFRQRLSSTGVNISTLEDQIRAQIAWSMVVRRKLRPRINISEDEIDAVVEQREKRSTQKQYRLAEIVIKGGPEDQMQKLTQDILNKLQEGAPFQVMAKQFSRTGSAAKGGDLGWMSENELPEEYKYAVAQMEPGQVTPPLKIERGYSIVLMVDAREAGEGNPVAKATTLVAPVEAEKPATMKKVVQKDMTVSLKQILIPVAVDEPKAVVKAKTARASQLAQEIYGCKAMDEKSKHFTARGTGDIGKIKVSALPVQIADQVKTLPVGQLSAPIPHRDGIAVLMVCDRDVEEVVTEVPVEASERSSTASVGPVAPSADEEMRERVANEIGMERLSRLQDHYLKDLRAASFIDLRM